MDAREAILFAWKAGFRDVILEGNNISVMNSICSNEAGLSSCGAIVADINQMSTYCNRVSFFFIKREDNCVAHSLVKYARNFVA